MIFAGSGCTGAIDKLVGILGLRIPADLDDRYDLSAHIPADERPVVFIGPFEHHSNELPWRESIADVVVIPRGRRRPHRRRPRSSEELERYADRPLKIGSFSAASNVTGIVTDTAAIAALLHRHGALSFWDFAAAGALRRHRRCTATPTATRSLQGRGLLSARTSSSAGRARRACSSSAASCCATGCPTCPAAAPSPTSTRPSTATSTTRAHREEGGTPAIVESIRAGLVFQLKAGRRRRRDPGARGRLPAPRGRRRGRTQPDIEILGNLDAERLSIVSFVVRAPSGRYLHHNFVVALLNDLFGIQSRGGCSCAGPYGHRLLGIDIEQSHEFEREIARGCEGIKPGWVRVNFNYFISDAGVRVHRRRGRAGGARRLAAARRTTGSTLTPGCGGTARAGRAAAAAGADSATTPAAR